MSRWVIGLIHGHEQSQSRPRTLREKAHSHSAVYRKLSVCKIEVATFSTRATKSTKTPFNQGIKSTRPTAFLDSMYS